MSSVLKVCSENCQKKPPEGGLIKLVMNLKYIYKKYGITNAKVNPISNIPTDTK